MPRVVIPFGGDDPYRARALDYVLGRFHYPVSIAETEGEWCKARAVLPVLGDCPADVVILHDADVFCEGLESAVLAVASGVAEWAMPHSRVYRLSERGSEAVYRGETWERQPLERPSYRGAPGGGIVVAHRDTLLASPLDPRFVGWGGEDEALGLALATLAGEPWRGRAPLIHLYHPREPKADRRYGSRANRSLAHRYEMARRKPEAMRALLEESC